MKTLLLEDEQIKLLQHALGVAEASYSDQQKQVITTLTQVRGIDAEHAKEQNKAFGFLHNKACAFADLNALIEKQLKTAVKAVATILLVMFSLFSNAQACLTHTIGMSVTANAPAYVITGIGNQLTLCESLKVQLVGMACESYTWYGSNNQVVAQGQTIYHGIEGYNNTMTLNAGSNYFQLSGKATENGQPCYVNMNITINVCATVGFDELQKETEILSVRYTDLLGREVLKLELNTLYIRYNVYTNGSVKSSKVILID